MVDGGATSVADSRLSDQHAILALERRYRDEEEQLRQQEQECERRRERLIQLRGVIELLKDDIGGNGL